MFLVGDKVMVTKEKSENYGKIGTITAEPKKDGGCFTVDFGEGVFRRYNEKNLEWVEEEYTDPIATLARDISDALMKFADNIDSF